MKNLKETWQTCEVARTESGYKSCVRAMMKQIDENENLLGIVASPSRRTTLGTC